MRFFFFFVLLLATAFSSCKKEDPGSEISATIDGNSWTSERIVTGVNTAGDLTKIEAFAADNTRIIFKMTDTGLSVSGADFPEDIFGVALANSLEFSATPSLHEIAYSLQLSGPSTQLTNVQVLVSEDQLTFSPLAGSLLESAPFTKSWVASNNRPSNNEYQLLKVRIEYGLGLTWESDVVLGVTSFRAQYDGGGLTTNEMTGDFTLQSLDRGSKKMNADFNFSTSEVSVSGGKILELGY